MSSKRTSVTLPLPKVDHAKPAPTATSRTRSELNTKDIMEATKSGNTQYPSRHTLWKKELAKDLALVPLNKQVTYTFPPSSEAFKVMNTEPNQMTTKTAENTSALWS